MDIIHKEESKIKTLLLVMSLLSLSELTFANNYPCSELVGSYTCEQKGDTHYDFTENIDILGSNENEELRFLLPTIHFAKGLIEKDISWIVDNKEHVGRLYQDNADPSLFLSLKKRYKASCVNNVLKTKAILGSSLKQIKVSEKLQYKLVENKLIVTGEYSTKGVIAVGMHKLLSGTHLGGNGKRNKVFSFECTRN